MRDKLCPLLAIASTLDKKGNTLYNCQEERCTWRIRNIECANAGKGSYAMKCLALRKNNATPPDNGGGNMKKDMIDNKEGK